jgi:hypothetical protein
VLSRVGMALDVDAEVAGFAVDVAFVEVMVVFGALGGANGDELEDAVTSSAPHFVHAQ